MIEIEVYKDAPVYETVVEILLILAWKNLRGWVTQKDVNEYVLSDLRASSLDIYCPLDALIRFGYSEAEAKQMLKDEDLEELLP